VLMNGLELEGIGIEDATVFSSAWGLPADGMEEALLSEPAGEESPVDSEARTEGEGRGGVSAPPIEAGRDMSSLVCVESWLSSAGEVVFGRCRGAGRAGSRKWWRVMHQKTNRQRS
jgi:hypothetical protein